VLQVVFRCDASLTIGTGHVMRCRTLAEALREAGAQCRFVCRAHPGHLIALIRQRGFAVSELRWEVGWQCAEDTPPHAAWLGADWRVDVEETILAAGETAPDWLIVDHYALDARWESALRGWAKRIMVIDDLADRPHDCDLLLDQNWHGAQTALRYRGRVPAACRCLLGPQYALLQPEYAALREKLPPRDGRVRRVLVFFGGSDPANITARACDALMAEEFAHLEVEIVAGRNHPDPEGLAVQAARRPRTRFSQSLPTLAEAMARADLMISGGGATTWERMCLGLPALVVSLADNQTAVSQALAKAGFQTYLGEAADVTTDVIAAALRDALDHPERLQAQSVRARELTDGQSVARACRYLLGGHGD
jgi:UDP-2,4-diacetamido-2,4,6-trideoxy-beta-L-altropyranose hydrolase